jgi:hypothetical protein
MDNMLYTLVYFCFGLAYSLYITKNTFTVGESLAVKLLVILVIAIAWPVVMLARW